MLARWLVKWIGWIQRYAWMVIILALVGGAGMAYYISGHLSVDTNTSDMISNKLPWKMALHKINRLFPQQSKTLAIVIDGDTPGDASRAQRALVARLKQQPKLFPYVFALDTEPFFRKNGLLFLDVPQLRSLSDQLLQAQPFLGTLAQDPSLNALFTLMDRALTHSAAAGFDLTPALNQVADGVAAATANRPFQFSWQKLVGNDAKQADATRKFIEVAPHLDYHQLLAGQPIMEAIHADVAALHLDAAHGVRVRLTGTVALEYQELVSAMSGAGIAFAVGLVFVVLLLFLALRSWKLVLAAAVTLVYGLLGTTFFAALAVGHLNLISIAFGVLYIGLGIDYALYLCMQYRERIGSGDGPRRALSKAGGQVGGFMLVCALTTSIGFFAFTPTAYTGVAELGLISGAGMFISLVLALSLLPAIIALLPPDPARVRLLPPDQGWIGKALSLPYTHGRELWIGAGVLAVGALALVPLAHFDYNPLDMRDPHSESVSTFRDLLKDPNVPTLTLDIMEPNQAAAQAAAARVAKLPLVRRAMTIDSFIPTDQAQKLAIIQNLAFLVGPSLMAPRGNALVADDARDEAAIQKLTATLESKGGAGTDAAARQHLGHALATFQAAYKSAGPAQRSALLSRLRGDLLGSWPSHLADLRDALQAGPVSFSDLPKNLVERWVASDGEYRVNVWPKQVLDNDAAIKRFETQVRAAEPTATGSPVEYVESGVAVVRAFQHAFAFSFVAILVLLLILLRNVVDTLLVLVPLVLAGLLTVGETVLAGVPFNFANVIALPLILGVGVDYGVYIVQRGRTAGNTNLLHTGAARAVLFGALITIANFGNLALSHYPGTRSLGVVLTLGLATTVLCALVLLPSLLAWRYNSVKSRHGT
ncbi:MAG TPA: MMPL family transporter [Nevskiaceae bacterium]|nr:MMPL family transporter [Nevskiaceae bacterium]